MNSKTYKPGYVWPAPAFPFREYYSGPECRIFIIENVQHNWVWMSEWANKFRDTDYFLVYCGWYHSPAFAKEAEAIFSVLNLNRERFFFMFNSYLEKDNFTKVGFLGDIINQNAWIDENLVMRPRVLPKKYQAIYVGRRSEFKRHYLAAKVGNLALVAGNNHGKSTVEVPQHDFINDIPLKPDRVCELINESHCGLILSAAEGACFASSEYLLCGIPVVSTPSTGGRDFWYDEYNSITCEPTEDAVADAVEEFVRNPRNSEVIRERHIQISNKIRLVFINHLQDIFSRHGVLVDAAKFFRENFFHKMRRSYKPDFRKIFA